MMRMDRKQIHGMRAMLLALVLAACGGTDTQDLRAFVDEVRGHQQAKIEPLPEFKPYETFLYQAGDLRGPFTPPLSGAPESMVAATSNSSIRPEFERPREPLEEYPLDSLRMVGTLEQKGETWALVEDNEGTIHRLQPGNHLGQNYGKIVRISENEVDLLEIVPDGLGGWMERPASLALSE